MQQKFISAVALFLCLSASSALADGAILSIMKPADKAKLDAFERTRAEALATVRKGPIPLDAATLDRALAGKPASVHGKNFAMEGVWRCRVLRFVSAPTPMLAIFPWYACDIFEDDAGAWLWKKVGEERVKGQFYDDGDTRMVYLGAAYRAGEKSVLYGADAARNRIAYAYWFSPKRMRLEFPAPAPEVLMDVMEMERP